MRDLKKKKLKQIALIADEELVAALRAAMEKSGRHLGPEAAWSLKKFFRIGPFARKDKAANGGSK